MRDFFETLIVIFLSLFMLALGVFLFTKDAPIMGLGALLLGVIGPILRFYKGSK